MSIVAAENKPEITVAPCVRLSLIAKEKAICEEWGSVFAAWMEPLVQVDSTEP